MQRRLALMMMGIVMVALSGCATQTSKPSDERAVANSSATMKGLAAPAGSPLAKITTGMRKKEVKDLLGTPSDENSYATGKVWIPFYFGDDARRTSWYYKGIGRVVFADGNAFGGGGGYVIRTDYDPNESGIAR